MWYHDDKSGFYRMLMVLDDFGYLLTFRPEKLSEGMKTSVLNGVAAFLEIATRTQVSHLFSNIAC